MRCEHCNIEMRALLTSLYCPNTDSEGRHMAVLLIAKRRWRAMRVPANAPWPPWATRGWNLALGGVRIENCELDDATLIAAMQDVWRHKAGGPGWAIPAWPLPYTDVSESMAFGPLND